MTALPGNGSVTLADGTPLLGVGQSLSVAQLTGLLFTPAAGAAGTSTFGYAVTDLAGQLRQRRRVLDRRHARRVHHPDAGVRAAPMPARRSWPQSAMSPPPCWPGLRPRVRPWCCPTAWAARWRTRQGRFSITLALPAIPVTGLRLTVTATRHHGPGSPRHPQARR